MIQKYVSELADRAGMQLSRVSIVDGTLLGCRDSHLLKVHAQGQTESALVYQSELDALQNGIVRERFESRVRAALARLQLLMEQAN